MTGYDVLIVGTGHAGAQAAITLRQRGFAGSVGMIGEEPDLPYERPPLSKDYLAGDKPFARLLLRPETFWAERDIAILPGQRVVAVDAVGHLATLQGGDRVGYGRMIWAAGGHPRALTCSGHDLPGVHAVRTRADVDRLRGELDAVDRVAVIGGGFIGLEAAAVLHKLGKRVVVLEAQDRVLARVAGTVLSRFYEAEHRDHGVEVRLGTVVDCIVARDGRAAGVRLADGEAVPAGMVIVGIGIVPAVAPLLAAGAEGGNGVLVDDWCRTSLPDICAAGDCALHRNAFAGGEAIRLESIGNANDMAVTIAKEITGALKPYRAVPWFWSNQYDLKLQTVGLSLGYDLEVVRGDPAARSFSVAYLKSGRLLALDCVNAVRDYIGGKALIGRTVAPALLADPSLALKDLATG